MNLRTRRGGVVALTNGWTSLTTIPSFSNAIRRDQRGFPPARLDAKRTLAGRVVLRFRADSYHQNIMGKLVDKIRTRP